MANYTKQAILDTFMKLLNERPVSRITVKDISDACGINRNTFYYHFRDIPSMVEELIKAQSDPIYNMDLDVNSLEDCIGAMIDHVQENKRALLNLFRSSNRDIYESYMWRNCDFFVRKLYDNLLKDLKVSASDVEILIRYSKCALFGQLLDWINSNMSYDLKAEFRRFCVIWPEVSRKIFMIDRK